MFFKQRIFQNIVCLFVVAYCWLQWQVAVAGYFCSLMILFWWQLH